MRTEAFLDIMTSLPVVPVSLHSAGAQTTGRSGAAVYAFARGHASEDPIQYKIVSFEHSSSRGTGRQSEHYLLSPWALDPLGCSSTQGLKPPRRRWRGGLSQRRCPLHSGHIGVSSTNLGLSSRARLPAPPRSAPSQSFMIFIAPSSF
jgi:hypothetical protein